MEEKTIILTENKFSELNMLYPSTGKSSNTGKRSEELVRYYFRCIDHKYSFSKASKGADIKVCLDKEEFEIEVKGTAENELAWKQLIVSGRPSYDRLKSGLPLYRVTSVYEKLPILYILNYQEDFNMEPEPRWKIKQKNA